jgi:hypothetical protein
VLPFRDFDGWLKQVNANDLSEIQSLALRLIFPHLVPSEDQEVAANADAISRMQSCRRRRYAGDFTLGPQRYYTLAHAPNGFDYGTLSAELSAYFDDNVGPCKLHDFLTEEIAGKLALGYQEKCMLLRLLGTPGSSAVKARLGIDKLVIPYRVERLRLTDVIDLRFPEVQTWFYEEFRDIHAFVTRELRKHVRPGVDPSTVRLPGTYEPASFFDMLPVLMEPVRGGNYVTDHIGQRLRLEKVSALIYPSARLDTGVTWRNGKIHSFVGWNLVDYRGLIKQFHKGLIVLMGGEPWKSKYEQYFHLQRDVNGSWMMVSPERNWENSEHLISDEDLRIRYKAGEEVFTGLIHLTLNISRATESPWLECMVEACKSALGGKILSYMGIKSFVGFQNTVSNESAILFECSVVKGYTTKLSKGFACFASPPERIFPSLDTEPHDYLPENAIFSAVENGMYIYYLRTDAVGHRGKT